MAQTPSIQKKGLSALEDQLSSEYLACIKWEAYSKTIQDPNLVNLANQISSDHRKRFDKLFSYLNSHS